MARYNHTFPAPRRKVSVLFNDTDNAILAYKRDVAFREFVNEWNKDIPELMGWSLVDFHRAYKKKQDYLQLSLCLV